MTERTLNMLIRSVWFVHKIYCLSWHVIHKDLLLFITSFVTTNKVNLIQSTCRSAFPITLIPFFNKAIGCRLMISIFARHINTVVLPLELFHTVRNITFKCSCIKLAECDHIVPQWLLNSLFLSLDLFSIIQYLHRRELVTSRRSLPILNMVGPRLVPFCTIVDVDFFIFLNISDCH